MKNSACALFFFASPSRSYAPQACGASEAGSWNFASDGEQNIPDDLREAVPNPSRVTTRREARETPTGRTS